MNKDVIYVDADDEIASIIDKIQNAKLNVIALVLPKRCTVLQSSVNMKILKKTITDSDKQVVLITSEQAILPLAGAIGLFVAKTLQSKPAIPPAPAQDEEPEPVLDSETTNATDDADIDKSKTIGELAGVTAVASTLNKEDQDQPIELDTDESDETDKKSKSKKGDKSKKDKKLAVPNFNKFRLKLIIGISAAVIFIVLIVLAMVVLPRASIGITMQYNSIPVNISATGSTTATTLNTQDMIVPAQNKTTEKTESTKFQATGQKNNGNKATGTMTIYNCTDNAMTIPAGTRFTNNGFSFTTNKEVSVPKSTFNSEKVCYEEGNLPGVEVTATSGGDQYNLSGGRIYSSSIGSGVYGKGSAMSGGTNVMVKTVSQSDCDTAKESLLSKKYDDQKTQLASQLTAAGFTPVDDSFAADTSNASCTPAVGSEATEATANVQVKMTMSGLSTDAMNTLISDEVNKNLNQSEKIYDTGIKTGKITINEKKADGTFTFTYSGEAKTGVKQDTEVIAKSVAGKKYGQTVEIIKAYPGVTDVTVKYSPFWVKKTPKDVKHITITFANPDGTQ